MTFKLLTKIWLPLSLSIITSYLMVLGYHYCLIPPFHCGEVIVEEVPQDE